MDYLQFAKLHTVDLVSDISTNLNTAYSLTPIGSLISPVNLDLTHTYIYIYILSNCHTFDSIRMTRSIVSLCLISSARGANVFSKLTLHQVFNLG